MKRSSTVRTAVLAGLFLLPILGLVLEAPNIGAYPRYNDGCQNCHGAFTGPTSPQGTIFPGGDKHRMHRANNEMNTECDLCHSSGDELNPFINSSDGTDNNPGLGCTGCHLSAGLQRHHATNDVSCLPCHSPSSAPPENTVPTYYGTADTNADNPCNEAGVAGQDENWSLFDLVGLDNDGDNDYDTADADCGVAMTPGEVSDPAVQLMLVDSHDALAGQMGISYGIACAAVENDLVFGPLSQLDVYGYSGRACNVGNSGSASWSYPAGSQFFVIVAQDGTSQGSFGKDSADAERPEDGSNVCGMLAQDLADRCD